MDVVRGVGDTHALNLLVESEAAHVALPGVGPLSPYTFTMNRVAKWYFSC